ncbi:MAG: hypothetical protein WBG46_04530 [Nonlabens sp.]
MKYLLLIIISLPTFLISQNEQKNSKLLFDDVLPLGVTLGYQQNFVDNDPTIGYDYNLDFNDHFIVGLDWMFVRTGKFLFKTGVYYESFNWEGSLRVPGSFLGQASDFIENDRRNLSFYTFELGSEYLFKLSKKDQLSIGLSIDMRWLNKDDKFARGRVLTNEENENQLLFINQSTNDGFIDYPVSINYYRKTENLGLFKIGLSGSMFGSADVYSDQLEYFDAENEVFRRSLHTINRSHLQFSLSWFPSKSLF